MNWRLALRLARRDVRRRPGRTALVLLLVAVPVCGMSLAAVVFRTEHLSETETFNHYHGDEVDAVLYPAADRAAPVELPEGTRTRDVRTTEVVVEGPESAPRWDTATDVPLDGPFQGVNELVDGRAPNAAGEVALSRQAAADAGIEIGDEATIRSGGSSPVDTLPDPPGEAQPVTVVGFVENRHCLSCSAVSIHPDQSLPGGYEASVEQLVLLPDGVSQDELPPLTGADGWLDPDQWPQAVTSGGEAQTAKVLWSWVVGAVVLTAAGIVISAAFAVGARRQLTTLGQLSASGAAPQLLRRTLALQGTVTGALGVAMGWLLAASILVLGRARLEELLDKRLPGWEVQPLDLAAIAVIGLVAATVAALLPARTAARIPTLAALAGRRPLTPVPRRLTLAGLAAIVIGLGLLGLAVLGGRGGTNPEVWAVVAIIGGVLQLLGACAVTPALAGKLEPLAGRLRGSRRLAARSLARHRTRTGAVVAAVAVTAALAVFAGGMVRGTYERDRANSIFSLPNDLPDDVALAFTFPREPDDTRQPYHGAPDGETLSELEEVIPDADQQPIRMALEESDSSTPWTLDSRSPESPDLAPEGATDSMASEIEPPLLADESTLDLFEVPAETRQILETDGLVWAGWVSDADEPADAVVTTPAGTELEATGVGPDSGRTYFGSLLISPDLATSLDLTAVDTAVAFRSPEPITYDQQDWLSALSLGLDESETAESLTIYSKPHNTRVTPLQIEMLLGAAALVVALFVIATSLALAAAESRDEREVLTVVGTRPRDLARSAGTRAALLAGLGSALAIPLGLAPLVVVSLSWDNGIPIRPPWPSMIMLVVVVPLAAALAATIASAIAQRTRPVQISTATFE